MALVAAVPGLFPGEFLIPVRLLCVIPVRADHIGVLARQLVECACIQQHDHIDPGSGRVDAIFIIVYGHGRVFRQQGIAHRRPLGPAVFAVTVSARRDPLRRQILEQRGPSGHRQGLLGHGRRFARVRLVKDLQGEVLRHIVHVDVGIALPDGDIPLLGNLAEAAGPEVQAVAHDLIAGGLHRALHDLPGRPRREGIGARRQIAQRLARLGGRPDGRAGLRIEALKHMVDLRDAVALEVDMHIHVGIDEPKRVVIDVLFHDAHARAVRPVGVPLEYLDVVNQIAAPGRGLDGDPLVALAVIHGVAGAVERHAAELFAVIDIGPEVYHLDLVFKGHVAGGHGEGAAPLPVRLVLFLVVRDRSIDDGLPARVDVVALQASPQVDGLALVEVRLPAAVFLGEGIGLPAVGVQRRRDDGFCIADLQRMEAHVAALGTGPVLLPAPGVSLHHAIDAAVAAVAELVAL